MSKQPKSRIEKKRKKIIAKLRKLIRKSKSLQVELSKAEERGK